MQGRSGQLRAEAEAADKLRVLNALHRSGPSIMAMMSAAAGTAATMSMK